MADAAKVTTEQVSLPRKEVAEPGSQQMTTRTAIVQCERVVIQMTPQAEEEGWTWERAGSVGVKVLGAASIALGCFGLGVLFGRSND